MRLLSALSLSGFLIPLTLAAAMAQADIYKTVDKNGRVTYTDVPPANSDAKPVELKHINSTPPPPATNPHYHQGPAPGAVANYQPHIAAPVNGTTLMANERSVTISVNLIPSLQEGDFLVYKLDGATLEKTTELSFVYNEPPRGEHSITVEVVDSENELLAQSEPVTIVVMRPLPLQNTNPVPAK